MALQPFAPKLNFLVKPRTDTKPLPKTMKYFFFMLKFVFALDFGFVKLKTRKFNVLVKLLTLAQSTIYVVILSVNLLARSRSVYLYVTFTLDVGVYYVFSLTLVLVKHTFHDYQIDLNSFDSEIYVDGSSYRVGPMIMLWSVVLFIYRFLTLANYCSSDVSDCEFSIDMIVSIIYSGILLASDVVLVVYTYVFHSAYLRLKKFTAYVVNDGTMVSCQYLYKSIAEMTEKAKKSFDVVLVVTLVSNTIDAIENIYLPFANESIKWSDPRSMSMAFMVVPQQLLMLFCPAISAGLLSGQVEKLTLVLHDKLIQGDKANAKDIRRFMAYTDGRPLRFRVWRVVPLDWRLPVVVVNVVITYLIVLIQFTHKNDDVI